MSFRSIIRLPKTVFLTALFLARNIWKTRNIPVIPKKSLSQVEFLPCTKDFVPSVAQLYSEFHQGRNLGVAKKSLLKLAGKKLCLVVRDKETGKIVGFSLYYFNSRDLKEKTVHSGFIGLLPEYRGRGIGTERGLHALRHFGRSQSLRGISCRVSLNNTASLKSTNKVGFKEKERYYDPIMGEERVYLVCDLAPYRESLGSEIIDENPQTLEREKFIK